MHLQIYLIEHGQYSFYLVGLFIAKLIETLYICIHNNSTCLITNLKFSKTPNKEVKMIFTLIFKHKCSYLGLMKCNYQVRIKKRLKKK